MPAGNGSKPDIGALRKLYSSSDAARAAFDYFAQRQKNSVTTSVDRLLAVLQQGGHDVSRREAVELFRSLDAAGCGAFKTGRKGYLSRFEWSVGLIDVGLAGSGEADKVGAISEAEKAEGPEEDAIAELLEHRYRLRPDTDLRLHLPANLSAVEAARIADFVRTLPFAP